MAKSDNFKGKKAAPFKKAKAPRPAVVPQEKKKS